MAERTIITWNWTNWLTVLIMVGVGFGVVALSAQLFHNRAGTPPVA